MAGVQYRQPGARPWDLANVARDSDLLSENSGKHWEEGLERRNDGICVDMFHQHGAQIGRRRVTTEEPKVAAGLMTWFRDQSACSTKHPHWVQKM